MATGSTERPTLDDIRRWPAAVSIPRACAAFGISKAHGYGLVKRGEFPVRVITMGGRYAVITADLVRLLGGSTCQPFGFIGSGTAN